MNLHKNQSADESRTSNQYIDDLQSNATSTFALQAPAEEKNVSRPDWFDEELFKKGKEFFKINFLSIFVSNLVGLFAILHMENTQNVLKSTHKSSDVESATKRYLSTLRHLYMWYTRDVFEEGNVANKSISKVRKMHLSAIRNKTTSTNEATAISAMSANQLDMVVTQWAFCGLVAIKSKEIGIYEDSKTCMEGFIHFWRVIGHLMGIEDRYNLCHPNNGRNTDSVLKDWQNNCRSILKNVVCPALEKEHSKSYDFTQAMLLGTRCIVPVIEDKVFRSYSLNLFEMDDLFNKSQEGFSKFQSFYYFFMVHALGITMHRPIVGHAMRKFVNFLLYIAITYADHPTVLNTIRLMEKYKICSLSLMILVLVMCLNLFYYLFL